MPREEKDPACVREKLRGVCVAFLRGVRGVLCGRGVRAFPADFPGKPWDEEGSCIADPALGSATPGNRRAPDHSRAREPAGAQRNEKMSERVKHGTAAAAASWGER